MPGRCMRCGKEVYAAEERLALGGSWHLECYTCAICNQTIDSSSLAEHRELGEIYCKQCYRNNFGIKGYGYGPNGPTLTSKGPNISGGLACSIPGSEAELLCLGGIDEHGLPKPPPTPPPRRLGKTFLQQRKLPPHFCNHVAATLGTKIEQDGSNNRQACVKVKNQQNEPRGTGSQDQAWKNQYEFTTKFVSKHKSVGPRTRAVTESTAAVHGSNYSSETNRDTFKCDAVTRCASESGFDTEIDQCESQKSISTDITLKENSQNTLSSDFGICTEEKATTSKSLEAIPQRKKPHLYGPACCYTKKMENISPRSKREVEKHLVRESSSHSQIRVEKCEATQCSSCQSSNIVSPISCHSKQASQNCQHPFFCGGNCGGTSLVPRYPAKQLPPPEPKSGKNPSNVRCAKGIGEKCVKCEKPVYMAELIVGSYGPYHIECFKCCSCAKHLESTTVNENVGELFCKGCYRRNFGAHGVGMKHYN